MKLIHTLPFALLVPISFGQDADPTNQTPPPATPTRLLPPLASTLPNTVIYTNIAGHPTAAVPGLPGVEFDPGTGTSHFDRVYGSPNGNWALTANANLATTEDELLLVNDAVVAQQGTQAPWGIVGENTDFIDTKLGVNDAGTVAAAINTTGDTNTDEYIVTRDSAGVWTIVAQEASPTNIATLPGTTWDDPLDSPAIDASGQVAFAADGIDGGSVTTTTDDFLMVGGNLVLQEGVDIPAGQVGAEFIENYDLSACYVSADGTHWLVQGDLTGSTTTDDVLIYDGVVVLQEDSIIPGSTYVNPIDGSGIVNSYMDAAGNWYARGNNDTTEQDWVVRNGVVIAETGQPFDGASAELWDDVVFSDCFFLNVGNTVGDWVIGGVTNNADPLRDGVLVKNGTIEVVRQGDPIDLDGNGLFDDDAFFDTFGNDDAHLTDDGMLYIVATIMDGTATRIGQGFFRIDTGAGAIGTNYCVAGANSIDPGGALMSAAGSNSIAAADLTLTAAPAPNQPFIFYYGPNQNNLAFGNGFRCVAGTLVRLPAGVGSNNEMTHVVDFVANGGNFGTLGTVNFQCWYRDPAGGGAFFNLSDGYEIVFTP